MTSRPTHPQPRLLVFSTVFPSAAQPQFGSFVRERMFRVGKHVPIVVVAPQPWFPLQGLFRVFRPHFRPMAPAREMMDGVDVYRPKFLCVPGILKWTDGLFMALWSFLTVRRAAHAHRVNIIDAHFGYPEGRAAVLLGRWLRLPVILTLRGKENRQSRENVNSQLRHAIRGADRLIAVSNPLQTLAVEQGADPKRVQVIGNGVDLAKFNPIAQSEARSRLGLPSDAQILISVGALAEEKGFHRVIECMPALLATHAKLHLLIAGAAGPSGNMLPELKRMVNALKLEDRVRFLGSIPQEELNVALSAADVFVLATLYEGWANVFLEAMACGLPVVTTDVGGNSQVVTSRRVGRLVPFGDAQMLQQAISEALNESWDRNAIRAYAESNSWDRRMQPLLDTYREVLAMTRGKRVVQSAEVMNAR